MRANSTGITVNNRVVEQAMDQIRDYVWNNWNDLEHFTFGPDSAIVRFFYEIPYMDESSGQIGTFPSEFVIRTSLSARASDGEFDAATGSITINIYVDTISKAAQIFDPSDPLDLWNEVRSHYTGILVHEITHALEPNVEILRKRNRYPEEPDFCSDENRQLTSAEQAACRDSYTQYINTPIEVSAFTNTIVYQLLNNDIQGLRLEDALLKSPTWLALRDFLSDKNKKLIYKRIYTRLYSSKG